MKTSVKTLCAFVLTALLLSISTLNLAAADKETGQTEVSAGIDFNKVVVTGNVIVELVQCNRQSVTIYEGYNKKLTTIMHKGDKLYINSTEIIPVTVVVFLKELQRIDAANTAIITTRGKFSLDVLQVFLKDEAKAYVNAEIGSLYTVIKDYSKLKLKGSTAEHTLVKDQVATLKTNHFAALSTTIVTKEVQHLFPDNKRKFLKDTVIAERKIK